MKRIIVQPITNIEGKRMKFIEQDSKNERDMLLTDAVRTLVFNMPPQRLTMADSINGKRIVEAISRRNGHALELDDDLYKWLKEAVSNYSPLIFGVNACQVQDAVEELEKPMPEVPDEKKTETKATEVKKRGVKQV